VKYVSLLSAPLTSLIRMSYRISTIRTAKYLLNELTYSLVFNHRLAVDSHTATHLPYFSTIEHAKISASDNVLLYLASSTIEPSEIIMHAL
jgi:hypothetical protein